MKPRTRRKPCIYCGKPSRRISKKPHKLHHTTGRVRVMNAGYECNKGCGAYWTRYFGPEKSSFGSMYSMGLVEDFICLVDDFPETSIEIIRHCFNYFWKVKITVSTAYLWFENFASEDEKRYRAEYQEI